MTGVSNALGSWAENLKPVPLTPEFRGWPKIRRDPVWMRITEKIDGTNACVVITEDYRVFAQSRTRILGPGKDNFGFWAWTQENAADLMELGPGYHYGEWWGKGIQRGYGVDDRYFSLFGHWYRGAYEALPECVLKVPELYRGEVSAEEIEDARASISDSSWIGHFRGSQFVCFADAEGLVVEYISGRETLRQKVIISEATK